MVCCDEALLSFALTDYQQSANGGLLKHSKSPNLIRVSLVVRAVLIATRLPLRDTAEPQTLTDDGASKAPQ
jgi:hypothetical protein